MKKKLWKCIRFKNLQTEISGYGYEYSFSRYVFWLVAGILTVIGIGKLNGLSLIYVFILAAAMLCFVPMLLIEQFRYLYAQNRFQAMTGYMEQMMYSFGKHPKILSALEETKELVDGEIKEIVTKIIENIETSKVMSYEEAFLTLEESYPCERVKEMHDFFIKVEQIGGQYQTALAAMIEDTKLWVERVYLFQKERSQMKKKIVLSILCVLTLCSVLFRLMAGNEEMTKVIESLPYQIGTTFIFVSFLCLFLLSQKLLSGKWIKSEKSMTEEQIEKDWMHIKEEPDKYPRARKRLKREIEKQFPRWLRGIILNLQTDNVYRTIVESSDYAPYVMRQPLRIFIEELGEDPVSMKPYDHFLKELPVPEIHSAVKMLYSYTNTDTHEAKEQLNAIMKRNIALTDRAERLENEDEVAKHLLLFYIPMFLGTGKIMLDMSMLFLVLFSLWGKLR
ncbi:MAG: hypothetical protein UHS41_02435 [Lachnospiraceae bacterium]|nr:hypothetical protein [Lachnospiraceae bacterium]